jgi:hypothetical protein
MLLSVHGKCPNDHLQWFKYPDTLATWEPAGQITAIQQITKFWEDVKICQEDFVGPEVLATEKHIGE